MREVELTLYEVRLAAQMGIERQLEAIRLARSDAHGFEGDGWGTHIEGACAELAVAKAGNRYWEAVARRPQDLAGDVGRLQVRSTKRSSGCLIVYKDDPDEAPFVFVVQHSPTIFRLIGWLRGQEAKHEEWWRTDVRSPAFFVPQSALQEIA